MALSVSFACFPAFEDSLTNFKQSKDKEKKSFSPLTPEWQVDMTGRRRESPRLCKGIPLYTSISRAQAGSAHEHTSPPTLPKHFLTWQIRMCESPQLSDIAGICHISVFMLAFSWRQRNPKWTLVSSLFLSPFLSILSSGYCRMRQEYGAKVNITCCIILRLAP